MKLEQIAAPPPSQSPQQRYASLHRAVEKGMASDTTWTALTETCLELGLSDEAVRSAERVRNAGERYHCEQQLVRHGLVAAPRTEVREATEDDLRSNVRELMAESFHFLMLDHMPMTVVAATVAFPVIVGLGGYLTRQIHPLMSLIVVVPVLLVLVVIGAVARRVLIEGAEGLEDPPRIHGLRRWFEHARRLGFDALVLGLVFLTPALLLGLAHAPWYLVVTTFVIGSLPMPLALALRTLRQDWRWLSPDMLLHALYRGGLSYQVHATVVIAMFAPAIVAWSATAGVSIWMRAAFVGPLMTAPLLIAARFLGVYMHGHRRELGAFSGLRELQSAKAAQAALAASQQRAAAPRTAAPKKRMKRSAKRPSRRRAEAPAPRPERPRRARQSQDNGRPPLQRPVRRIAGVPQPETPAVPRAQRSSNNLQAVAARTKAMPKKQTRSRPAPERDQVVGDDMVDFTSMPGFRVVAGDDRVAAGAASERRRRR